MTELISAAIVTIAGYLTLVALLTTTAYLIPQRAGRIRQIWQEKPGRAFIVGLVNLLFFGILAAVFNQGGDVGGLLGLLILLALLGLAVSGLAGLLLLLRHRFYPPHEETNHALLAVTLRSSGILVAGLLAPVVGWFILAPILLITGLGAAIMSLVQRKPAAASPGAS